MSAASTDKHDIADRLRRDGSSRAQPLFDEAANEIERLRSLPSPSETVNGEMREALKPFARLIDTIECTTSHEYGDDAEWDMDAGEYSIVKLGDLRRARDVLSRASSAPAGAGWQDIASAPKDGSEFLALNARAEAVGYRVVYFDDAAKEPYIWRVEDAGKGFNHHRGFFTHWMPLPAPPATIADKCEAK